MQKIYVVISLLLSALAVASAFCAPGVASYVVAGLMVCLVVLLLIVHGKGIEQIQTSFSNGIIAHLRRAPLEQDLPQDTQQAVAYVVDAFIESSTLDITHQAECAHANEEKAAQITACEAQSQTLVENMRALSQRARDSMNKLTKGVRYLSNTVGEIGDAIEAQKFSLHTTSSSMDLIAQSAFQVSDSVHTLSDGAQNFRGSAETGQSNVREAVSAVQNVQHVISELQGTMESLESHSQNIGRAMSSIADIADQTNLLALNAAIEAARAGEAGRGFSVVASEVRKLSEGSMRATQEITNIVKDVQSAALASVKAVQTTNAHTQESVEQATNAGQLMDVIVHGMDTTVKGLAAIAAATSEQTQSSESTNASLEEISFQSARTADNIQQFTANIATIYEHVEDLDYFIEVLTKGQLSSVPQGREKFFTWGKELDLDILFVDSQHKILYSYINALHTSLHRGDSKEIMLDIITALRAYTATHFSTEEQYFSQSGYPEVEKHKDIHRRFVDRLIETETKFSKGEMVITNELLVFLKDWLFNHIMTIDQGYANYVKKMIANEGGHR